MEVKHVEISSGKNIFRTMEVPGAHSESNGVLPRVCLCVFILSHPQRMIDTSSQSHRNLCMTGPSPQSNGAVPRVSWGILRK